MTYMRKFLDMLNMNNWKKTPSAELLPPEPSHMDISTLDVHINPPSANFINLKSNKYNQINISHEHICEKNMLNVPIIENNKEYDYEKDNFSEESILTLENEQNTNTIPGKLLTETAEHNENNIAVIPDSDDIFIEKDILDCINEDDFPRSDNEKITDNGENNIDNYMVCNSEEVDPYKSSRLIIGGLHIFFINVAREILEQNSINIIPLMREYNLSEDDLNQIICEMQEANIIDKDKNALMSLDEFERFVDIYEPGLFKCKNTIFDKKNFIDIGEIIFRDGVESVYDILPANEVIDYLNIMENLNIISYDDDENRYDILLTKEKFYDICKCVPNFSKNLIDEESKIDIDNMNGHDFELFCADILRKNNFENVNVTQESGDHGIDILAEKDEITYAIQCKCYSADIGNAAIQQAHTGKSLYRKDIAVVLTNRYFTAQAIEEANSLGVKLWNRDKLNGSMKKSL